MKIYKILAPLTLAFMSSVNAAPVDLSGWGSEGQGNWAVQAGNNSVFQSQNGQPTVFFETGSNSLNTALSGTIEVQTASDDDFIGFVLGYQAGELSSSNTDYWLIDWKQSNQFYNGGTGSAGLALSHVTDSSNANSFTDFWGHTGGVNEIARATSLGATGWSDNTEYLFDLTFTNNLIEVYVDNILELSVTAADAGVSQFNDGAFGFYNYSQSRVLYAGIQQNAVVPEPSILALFGLGIFGLGLSRRKMKK